MKKTMLSFLFFGLLAIVTAQNAPFPLPGMIYGEAYYCNYFDCPNGEYSNNSFFYKGDTVLCGMTYHLLAEVQNPKNVVPIRVQDGKYILLGFTQVPCTSELVLYDFNLEVGNKFPSNTFWWLADSLVVLQKDSIQLMNGEFRKRLVLQPDSPFPLVTLEWVDGIGNIRNGFFRYSDDEGGHEVMVCVKDSSGLLFQNTSSSLDCDSILCRTPLPDFTSQCINKTIQFENKSKFSSSYSWDFGDGTTSTEVAPNHTYDVPGCYLVTLSAFTECLPNPISTYRQINVAMGDYWQPVFTPDFKFREVFFLNSSLGWAVGGNTIHKTTDGGHTWQHTNVTPPAYPDKQYLRFIHFYDELHGVVAAYNSQSPADSSIKTALWTDDGGATWQFGNAPTAFYPYQVVMNSPTTGYAVSGFDFFRTVDGGKNWLEMTNQPFHYVNAVFPITEDTVFYCASFFTGPGYYLPMLLGKSTDGVNFDLIQIDSSNVPGLAGNVWPTDLYFLDSQRGWIIANNGYIIHTVDGGVTWELQFDAPYALTEIKFASPLHGMAIGNNKNILETFDGGEHWDYTYCRPNTAYYYGYLDFEWPEENYPLLVEIVQLDSSNLLTLTDVPIFEDCAPNYSNEKHSSDFQITLHPNPTSYETILSIVLPSEQHLTINLYNMLGQTVKVFSTSTFFQSGETKIPLNMESIPLGIYLLTVESSNLIVSQSIMIQ